jgi:adenylate cyclase
MRHWGQIGFAGCADYTAIGTVTNLAARLCDMAEDGQILVTRRIAAAIEQAARCEPPGDFNVKGLTRPVAHANVVSVSREIDQKPDAA